MRYANLPRQLKLGCIAFVLASMLAAIWLGFHQSQIDVRQAASGPLGMACGLHAVYCALNAFAWLLILKSLGYEIPTAAGIALWIRCESFRWLPGGIWNFGARACAAERYGVTPAVGAASMSFELAFSVATRVILAACGGVLFAEQLQIALTGTSVAIGIACAVILMLASIRFLGANRRRAWLTRWNDVQPTLWSVLKKKRWPHHAALLLYYLSIGLLQGVALKCLVLALLGNRDVSTMSLVIANAAAWLVGFFAIFAPGGLVVREATLATALTAWFSPAESISIAVSWRVLQIAVELLLLMCALRWLPGRSASEQKLKAPLETVA